MKRKVCLVILTALAALGLCLGLAACEFRPPENGATGGLPGDEHLVYEKNESGDGYTVMGLEEQCTHTEISIPSYHNGLPVTAIRPAAFIYIDSIEKVTISDQVKTIGAYAFMECTGLKEVDLGGGLETIGVEAFYNCTSLAGIELPDSLLDIGAYAFTYCPFEEIAIPDSVMQIGSMAFAYCESISKVTLGKGLRAIGSFAFSHIAAEELVVPDSVTDLGDVCFGYNSALKTVTLGFGCTGIPYGAFFQCTSLETVTLNSVCLVTDSAFGDCISLRRIYFYSDAALWNESCSIGDESNDNPENGYGNTYFREADLYFYSEEPIYDGAHWGYNADGEETVWEEPAEEDPHLIYELSEDGSAYTVTGLDEDCTDKKIVIPAFHEGLPVTMVGRNAFWERTHIEEVVLSSEIIALDYGAFCYCSGLKTINFPKRLRAIGDFAFYECTSLEKAELPASLRLLSLAAFEFCTGLQSVFIPKNAEMGERVFHACTSLTDVTIEEGFDSLGIYAFAECFSLTAIELPESLTKIEVYAFYKCPLTEIVIPENVYQIGMAAFGDCGSLSKVTFGSGLRYIEAYAFQETALTEVHIPDSVYLIGIQAFAFIEPLESVILGTSLASCGYGAFAMCSNIKEVTIINPTGIISDAAFGGCYAIDTVYYFGGNEDLFLNWEEFCNENVNLDSAENPENGYGNTALCEAENVYLYSEEPIADGTHWHFGEDGRPEIWA